MSTHPFCSCSTFFYCIRIENEHPSLSNRTFNKFFKIFFTLTGDGVFVIGQEQDILGGDFNLVESFIGEISLLNIWDRVLDKREVRVLQSSCDKQTDVIQAWPDFLGGITGRVLKLDNHFCQGKVSGEFPQNSAVHS